MFKARRPDLDGANDDNVDSLSRQAVGRLSSSPAVQFAPNDWEIFDFAPFWAKMSRSFVQHSEARSNRPAVSQMVPAYFSNNCFSCTKIAKVRIFEICLPGLAEDWAHLNWNVLMTNIQMTFHCWSYQSARASSKSKVAWYLWNHCLKKNVQI